MTSSTRSPFVFLIPIVALAGYYTVLAASTNHHDGESKSGLVQRVNQHLIITQERMPELADWMIPDSGAYYSYSFSDYRDRIADPQAQIERLYSIGFQVTMAWYREGSCCGCVPLNSDYATGTIIRPFFVVRLQQSNDDLLNYNFHELRSPKRFGCKYGVTVYSVQGG